MRFPNSREIALTPRRLEALQRALLVLLTHIRFVLCVLGRLEISVFLGLYFLTLALQLITTGSFLAQGSTTLIAFTAIHAGAVSAVFWTLLGNGIISTQIVEDGTMSSIIVSVSRTWNRVHSISLQLALHLLLALFLRATDVHRSRRCSWHNTHLW
jgi:hypothetical protein